MGLFSKTPAQAPTVPAAPKAPVPGAAVADVAPGAPAPIPAPVTPILRAGATVSPVVAPPQQSERQVYLQKMKLRIHQQLVERLDMQNLKSLPPEVVRGEVRILIRELCQSEKGLINSADQERLMDDVMDETFGLGPLEGLLKDPTITDILVNRFDRIYVERRGRLEMVDARLADGSRVNVVIPPLAIDGPALSIRRFGARRPGPEELVELGTLSEGQRDALERAVAARRSILVSGGTGSGKTTLLNALSSFLAAGERVVTIEDAAELRLQQSHVVRLESRPPGVEGRGEVTIRDLLRNALRMRPDRIVIGEVRGPEALDLLTALNTGHDGALSTVHANSPADALRRLETLALMAGVGLPHAAIAEQVRRGIDLVVHLRRRPDGARVVTEIAEVEA